MPRGAELKGQIVRVVFQQPPRRGRAGGKTRAAAARRRSRRSGSSSARKPSERLTLDAPVLTVAQRRRAREAPAGRARPRSRRAWCRRCSSIEDRRFYEHPGIDPIGMVGAVLSNLRGKRATIGRRQHHHPAARAQRLPAEDVRRHDAAGRRAQKSLRRKLLEIWVSIILTTRASKDEILEMYLNDMTLGQRGSFGDRRRRRKRRGCSSARTSATSRSPKRRRSPACIQSPSALSPFNNPARCQRAAQRRAAGDGRRRLHRRRTPPIARRTSRSSSSSARSRPRRRTSSTTSARRSTEQYPGLTTTTTQAVDVYTTLDLHLQRLAQDAVRDGLTQVDSCCAKRKRKGKAEAALIAVDPRTGEILAFVGGRSYNQSQYNRAIVVAPAAGLGVQAVRLPRRVRAGAPTRAAPTSRRRRSRTTSRRPSSSTIRSGRRRTTRTSTTARSRSATRSRTRATSPRFTSRRRPATTASRRSGRSSASATRRKPYPSIALGVFEATPFEIATAYTLFPNGGMLRPLQHIAADHERRQGRARRSRRRRAARSRGRTRRSSSRT